MKPLMRVEYDLLIFPSSYRDHLNTVTVQCRPSFHTVKLWGTKYIQIIALLKIPMARMTSLTNRKY